MPIELLMGKALSSEIQLEYVFPANDSIIHDVS